MLDAQTIQSRNQSYIVDKIFANIGTLISREKIY